MYFWLITICGCGSRGAAADALAGTRAWPALGADVLVESLESGDTLFSGLGSRFKPIKSVRSRCGAQKAILRCSTPMSLSAKVLHNHIHICQPMSRERFPKPRPHETPDQDGMPNQVCNAKGKPCSLQDEYPASSQDQHPAQRKTQDPAIAHAKTGN